MKHSPSDSGFLLPDSISSRKDSQNFVSRSCSQIAAASQASPLLHGHVSCLLLHPFLRPDFVTRLRQAASAVCGAAAPMAGSVTLGLPVSTCPANCR